MYSSLDMHSSQKRSWLAAICAAPLQTENLGFVGTCIFIVELSFPKSILRSCSTRSLKPEDLIEVVGNEVRTFEH